MPTTNYLNDLAEQPKVVRIYDTARPFDEGVASTGTHSGLTQGKFVGKDTSGNVVEADARSSVNVPAIGVLAYSSQQPYTYGSKTGNKQYDCLDMYDDHLTFKLTGLTLTIGQPIWLSSGGGITQNHPNNTDDIRQQVAWAVSASEYAVRIFDAERIGW